jgi:hypothetical protein
MIVDVLPGRLPDRDGTVSGLGGLQLNVVVQAYKVILNADGYCVAGCEFQSDAAERASRVFGPVARNGYDNGFRTPLFYVGFEDLAEFFFVA